MFAIINSITQNILNNKPQFPIITISETDKKQKMPSETLKILLVDIQQKINNQMKLSTAADGLRFGEPETRALAVKGSESYLFSDTPRYADSNEECEKLCDNNDCNGFYYDKDSGLCSMSLGSMALGSPIDLSTSYYRYPYLDYYVEGNNSYTVDNEAKCKSECTNNLECKGYSYDFNKNLCSIKNNLEQPILNTDSTFFYKDYTDRIINAPDNDYIISENTYDGYASSTFASLYNANVETCKQLCSISDKCKGFNYNNSDKHCALKNSAISDDNTQTPPNYASYDYDYYAKELQI